jgi:hypothetical protein
MSTDLASVMARRQLGVRTAPPHDTTSTGSSKSPELVVRVRTYGELARVAFLLGVLVGLGVALVVASVVAAVFS